MERMERLSVTSDMELYVESRWWAMGPTSDPAELAETFRNY
jgi:hypothetical protein